MMVPGGTCWGACSDMKYAIASVPLWLQRGFTLLPSTERLSSFHSPFCLQPVPACSKSVIGTTPLQAKPCYVVRHAEDFGWGSGSGQIMLLHLV